MIYRVLLTAFLLCPAVDVSAETPPEEAEAIKQLKGIPSNLQKNRDGTVRFLRFSKPIVLDEHVARTAAFPRLDYLAVVTPTVTDAGLAHLGELTNLDTLFLSDSSITDRTVLRLSSLKKLERCYLDRTQISDTGLSGISELTSLTTLSLAGTNISDNGIATLMSLINLETLDLSNTRVTSASLPVLSHLPKLRFLSLQGLRVSLKLSDHNATAPFDIDDQTNPLAPLANAPALETLVLRRTIGLTPESIADLVKSKTLRFIDVRQTSLTASEVASIASNRDQPDRLRIAVDPQPGQSLNALQKFLAGQPLRRQPEVSPPISPTTLPQGKIAARADQRFGMSDEVPNFQRHVIPLFGKLGCNGRTCHGSFQGKGGFNLSMFGYDFDADLAALTEGDHPRIDRENVSESLILTKPTNDEEHGGGRRFTHNGWEYQLLRKWIANGAQGIAGKPSKLVALNVSPAEVVFSAAQETVQLKCIAIWADGTREDVTPLVRFQSNDETLAEVSDTGLITSKSAGDTHVVSFYDNGIFSTDVMMPVSENTGHRYPPIDRKTPVDRFVVDKLSKLGVIPSAVCSDEQFLRRVSLDLVGTLPSADELARFVADTTNDKRSKKIDELLDSKAYATWWAVKLADLTGSNAQALGSTDMNSPAAMQWNAWIQRRLAENVGWDRIAAGIILASSRRPAQTYESYVAEQSMHLKRRDGTDFTALENPMHYYWFRSNNQTDTDRALTFGYTFLGVRLQCAQCHKHPFDQWSKDDFDQFARFFERIRTGAAPDARASQLALKSQLGVPAKLDTAALRRQMYLRVSAEGLPIPWNEVYIDPPSAVRLPARILGGEEFDLNAFDDPREPLFAWLVEKDNPYFAPAFVNRVWAHYFGKGIVDPPDDFNQANPPVNKRLLSWLSSQFIEHGFDIKWLHRTITNSDTYQRSSIVTDTNRADERNFSRALVRRLPAEVTIDAILRATANDKFAAQYLSNTSQRKTAQHPRSFQARGIDYSLLVFGKPRRTTNCDCERQNSPTLLQSLYVRNDAELIGWLERPDGWLMQVSQQLKQPLSPEVTVQSTTNGSTNSGRFATEEETLNLIRAAYQRTLTRSPTSKEIQIAVMHIQQCENTVEGLRDLLWALINSQEFLTNH